ncbi:MAG: hypothetical protein IKB38_06260 [Clostridia bacterium]|nr:hypothetical protein [Clostridia bacterium]
MIFDGNLLLFLTDDYVAEKGAGVSFKIQAPKSIRSAFIREYPWENFIYLYTSLIYDEDAREYRIYYGARDKKNHTYLALATSKDGVHFEKPQLNVLPYKGFPQTNIVKDYAGDGVVYLDAHAPKSERYKHFYHINGSGMFLDVSEDGIHWSERKTNVSKTFNDGFNAFFYDEHDKLYRLFFRAWSGEPLHRMAVTYECGELDGNFSVPVPKNAPRRNEKEQPYMSDSWLKAAIDTDEDFPENTDIYTFAPNPYPSSDRYYIAFPALYRHITMEEGARFASDGTVTTGIFASADGKRFQKHMDGRYVQNVEYGRYRNNMAYHAAGLLRDGDEMLSAGTIYVQTHGDVDARRHYGDGEMLIYRQRKDGFISLEIDDNGGYALTVPCRITERITVNAKCRQNGELSFWLTDGKQHTFIGRMAGDDTSFPLNVPAGHIGTVASIRIEGKSASLFAIEFS